MGATMWSWQLNDTFLRSDTVPGCDGETDVWTFRRRLRPRFAVRRVVETSLLHQQN